MRRSGTGRLDDETFGNPFRDAKLWRPRNGRPGMRAAPAGEAGVAALHKSSADAMLERVTRAAAVLLPVDKNSGCGTVPGKEHGETTCRTAR
jgi:hypothetical protein